MNILEKIKDWLTLGVVPLVGLAIASAAVLLAPNSYLVALGLDNAVQVYKVYLGGALVLSISILIPIAIKGVWDVFLRRYVQEFLTVWFYRRELHKLTDDEKAILSPYVEQQTRSQYFSMQDGVVLGLQQRKIIIRIGSVGLPGFDFNFPFQIQPWAWEYLNKHPELLGLKSSTNGKAQ